MQISINSKNYFYKCYAEETRSFVKQQFKLAIKLMKRFGIRFSSRMRNAFACLSPDLLIDLEGALLSLLTKNGNKDSKRCAQFLDGIVFFCNKYKRAFPSQRRLADLAGSKSSKYASNQIRILQRLGLITAHRNSYSLSFKSSNHYTLHPMFYLPQLRSILSNFIPSLNRLPEQFVDIANESKAFISNLTSNIHIKERSYVERDLGGGVGEPKRSNRKKIKDPGDKKLIKDPEKLGDLFPGMDPDLLLALFESSNEKK